MFGKIIDHIEKNNGGDAVVGIYLSVISEIKKSYNQQQVELNKIKSKYSKIEKERLSKKKAKENALIFFNGVYTGKTNKNNLPDGKGTILFQSRDKDFPDDNDMYIGEFINGTKTGIGKYTYLNDRNIGKHPFTIPHYLGEWSGDSYYGLGSKLMDQFETIQTYEGEFKNNKVFGFGKWVSKNEDGDLELIGYFDDGAAVAFGLRIQKDKNNKIVAEKSGLCEYDNTDINNKKSIIHFQFPGDDFWEVIDDKEKRKPIIQELYDVVIDKGYFNQEIRTEKFQKLKQKIQSLHTELLFEVNSYFNNNYKNKKYFNFLEKQGELKNKLFISDQSKQIQDVEKLIKLGIAEFKSLKKSLTK